MMPPKRSPFYPYFNAIIKYAIDPVWSSDPQTGNPVSSGGTIVEYKAFLKLGTEKIRQLYSPGTDSTRNYYTGWLVEPTILPCTLPVTLEGYMQSVNGDPIEGHFEIQLVPRSAVNFEKYTGQKIECYFTINNNDST